MKKKKKVKYTFSFFLTFNSFKYLFIINNNNKVMRIEESRQPACRDLEFTAAVVEAMTLVMTTYNQQVRKFFLRQYFNLKQKQFKWTFIY